MKRVALAGYKASHFHYAVAGRVATITLNRPDRKNPLTFDSGVSGLKFENPPRADF